MCLACLLTMLCGCWNPQIQFGLSTRLCLFCLHKKLFQLLIFWRISLEKLHRIALFMSSCLLWSVMHQMWLCLLLQIVLADQCLSCVGCYLAVRFIIILSRKRQVQSLKLWEVVSPVTGVALHNCDRLVVRSIHAEVTEEQRWRLTIFSYSIRYWTGRYNIAPGTFTQVFCRAISWSNLTAIPEGLCHPGIGSILLGQRISHILLRMPNMSKVAVYLLKLSQVSVSLLEIILWRLPNQWKNEVSNSNIPYVHIWYPNGHESSFCDQAPYQMPVPHCRFP